MRVHQVTSLVHSPPQFVYEVALLVLQDYYIALFISVEVSEDIILIESTLVGFRWHLHFGFE